MGHSLALRLSPGALSGLEATCCVPSYKPLPAGLLWGEARREALLSLNHTGHPGPQVPETEGQGASCFPAGLGAHRVLPGSSHGVQGPPPPAPRRSSLSPSPRGACAAPTSSVSGVSTAAQLVTEGAVGVVGAVPSVPGTARQPPRPSGRCTRACPAVCPGSPPTADLPPRTRGRPAGARKGHGASGTPALRPGEKPETARQWGASRGPRPPAEFPRGGEAPCPGQEARRTPRPAGERVPAERAPDRPPEAGGTPFGRAGTAPHKVTTAGERTPPGACRPAGVPCPRQGPPSAARGRCV